MPPPNEKNEKNKANATANAKLKLISFIQLFNYLFSLFGGGVLITSQGYPSRMTPLGLKLWGNAFQTIPNITRAPIWNRGSNHGRPGNLLLSGATIKCTIVAVPLRTKKFPKVREGLFLDFFRNFERPFTPPGWLRSASNFGKTRFRRSPTFHFSTAKTSKQIDFFQMFERPFTPRGWLRSASNFGKTRFRRSPTFHFSTLKQFSVKIWTTIFVGKFCVLSRGHIRLC